MKGAGVCFQFGFFSFSHLWLLLFSVYLNKVMSLVLLVYGRLSVEASGWLGLCFLGYGKRHRGVAFWHPLGWENILETVIFVLFKMKNVLDI